MRRVARLRRARRGYRGLAPALSRELRGSLAADGSRGRPGRARDFRRAEELYDQTITAADRVGLVITGALAREYCGDLYAREGRDRVASAYLNAAMEGWSSLGADGKVEQLCRDYPALLRPAASELADPDAQSLLELTNAMVSELGTGRSPRTAARHDRVGHRRATRGPVRARRCRARPRGRVRARHTIVEAVEAADVSYAASVVRYVERSDRPVLISDTAASVHGRDQHLHAAAVRSVLCIPLSRGGVQRALVYLESTDLSAFTPAHLETMRLLSGQVATALENAQLVDRLADALRSQTDLVFAQSRFVPDQLLRELGRDTLVAIDAGDAVARDMTILYTDIRGYTHIQEGLDPRHGIGFLNDYLRRMEPAIVTHGGFVDSYVGDGMIALFAPAADGALRAALAMRRIEREVGEERRARGLDPVRTGIAVHTGKVVIGTFGGVNQLRCGVVGDAVNLASRIEGLTRDHAPLLVSESGVRAARGSGGVRPPAGRSFPRRGSDRGRDRVGSVRRGRPRHALGQTVDDAAPRRRARRVRSRRIEDACRGFEEVARAVPGDSGSRRSTSRVARRCSIEASPNVGTASSPSTTSRKRSR